MAKPTTDPVSANNLFLLSMMLLELHIELPPGWTTDPEPLAYDEDWATDDLFLALPPPAMVVGSAHLSTLTGDMGAHEADTGGKIDWRILSSFISFLRLTTEDNFGVLLLAIRTA